MKTRITMLLLLVTGCLNWLGVAAMAQTPEPPTLKPGWKPIDAGGRFSFHLPEDMQPQNVHGIDSYVGEYRNKNLRVTFDYGLYSNSLDTLSSQPEYKEFNRVIGGRKAKIVYYRATDAAAEYKYYAAVYFPAAPSHRASNLNLSAEFNDKHEWETAQTIFESIRFRL